MEKQNKAADLKRIEFSARARVCRYVWLRNVRIQKAAHFSFDSGPATDSPIFIVRLIGRSVPLTFICACNITSAHIEIVSNRTISYTLLVNVIHIVGSNFWDSFLSCGQ